MIYFSPDNKITLAQVQKKALNFDFNRNKRKYTIKSTKIGCSFYENSLHLLRALLIRSNDLNDTLSLEEIDYHFNVLHLYSLADCKILQILLQDLGFTVVNDELKFYVKCIRLNSDKKDIKENIKRETIDFSKLFILTNNCNCFIRKSLVPEALFRAGYRSDTVNIQSVEKYLISNNCVRKRAHRGSDIYRYVMFVDKSL